MPTVAERYVEVYDQVIEFVKSVETPVVDAAKSVIAQVHTLLPEQVSGQLPAPGTLIDKSLVAVDAAFAASKDVTLKALDVVGLGLPAAPAKKAAPKAKATSAAV